MTIKKIYVFAGILIAALTIAISCGSGGGSGTTETDLPPEPPKPDITTTSPATLHPKVGFSAFAIQSATWDCDGFLAAMDRVEEWHMAMLWRTFGNNNGCLDRVLASPKLKSLEIHLINEACHRRTPGKPGSCGSHEFLHGISEGNWQWRLKQNDPVIIQQFQDYALTVAAHLDAKMRNGVECYISPSLESNMDDAQAINNLVAATRLVFPNCKIVWTPVVGNNKRAADMIETHSSGGPAPTPCIKNLDGQDISFAQRPSQTKWNISENEIFNYFERTRNCEFSLLWTIESNCQVSTGGTNLSPLKRNCSNQQFVYDLQADYLIRWQNEHRLP